MKSFNVNVGFGLKWSPARCPWHPLVATNLCGPYVFLDVPTSWTGWRLLRSCPELSSPCYLGPSNSIWSCTGIGRKIGEKCESQARQCTLRMARWCLRLKPLKRRCGEPGLPSQPALMFLASGASATRSWTWAIKLGAQANRLFLKWSRQWGAEHSPAAVEVQGCPEMEWRGLVHDNSIGSNVSWAPAKVLRAWRWGGRGGWSGGGRWSRRQSNDRLLENMLLNVCVEFRCCCCLLQDKVRIFVFLQRAPGSVLPGMGLHWAVQWFSGRAWANHTCKGGHSIAMVVASSWFFDDTGA